MRFDGGQITTVASGAGITLNGTLARIADASDPTTDSALAGLTENDGTVSLVNAGAVSLPALATNAGTLTVLDSTSLSIAGGLSSSGTLGLDSDGYSSEGGAQLSIAGTLTNTGSIVVGPYFGGLSAPTVLTVGGVAGSGGQVAINGGSAASNPAQAEMDVLAAVAGTLTQTLAVSGNALLRFGSGQITRVASGAGITLNGTLARIADASDPTTDSALAGLAENDGTVSLVNVGAVSFPALATNAGTCCCNTPRACRSGAR